MKDFPKEKTRIMQVATDLFAEKGYAATSIRDIARALDVSIATIYYYFKNKEDLLYTIIHADGEDVLDMLDNAIRQCSDPLQRLRTMLFVNICRQREKSHMIKVFANERDNLTKKFKVTIFEQHRKIYNAYLDQLKELQQLKLIQTQNLSVAAFGMFGMINWVYRWYRDDGKLTIEEVATTLIDIVFNGLLTPSGRKRSSETKKDFPSNPFSGKHST